MQLLIKTIVFMSNNFFFIYSKYVNFINFSGNFNQVSLTGRGTVLSYNVYGYLLLSVSTYLLYSLLRSNLCNLFSLDDQNIGPSHDSTFFLILNLFFIVYNTLFSLDNFNVLYLYVRFFNLLFIGFYLIILVLGFGFFLPLFIKGSAQHKLYFYTLFVDFLQINSFLLRITIQFVRASILYGTLYLFFLGWSEVILSNSFNGSGFGFGYLVLSSLRLSFEIIHSIFIIFMQTILFLFVLVWLFQFFLFSFSIFSKE